MKMNKLVKGSLAAVMCLALAACESGAPSGGSSDQPAGDIVNTVIPPGRMIQEACGTRKTVCTDPAPAVDQQGTETLDHPEHLLATQNLICFILPNQRLFCNRCCVYFGVY